MRGAGYKDGAIDYAHVFSSWKGLFMATFPPVAVFPLAIQRPRANELALDFWFIAWSGWSGPNQLDSGIYDQEIPDFYFVSPPLRIGSGKKRQVKTN